jgi:hypothetical protein
MMNRYVRGATPSCGGDPHPSGGVWNSLPRPVRLGPSTFRTFMLEHSCSIAEHPVPTSSWIVWMQLFGGMLSRLRHSAELQLELLQHALHSRNAIVTNHQFQRLADCGVTMTKCMGAVPYRVHALAHAAHAHAATQHKHTHMLQCGQFRTLVAWQNVTPRDLVPDWCQAALWQARWLIIMLRCKASSVGDESVGQSVEADIQGIV